jgi:hypothetical protein
LGNLKWNLIFHQENANFNFPGYSIHTSLNLCPALTLRKNDPLNLLLKYFSEYKQIGIYALPLADILITLGMSNVRDLLV